MKYRYRSITIKKISVVNKDDCIDYESIMVSMMSTFTRNINFTWDNSVVEITGITKLPCEVSPAINNCLGAIYRPPYEMQL